MAFNIPPLSRNIKVISETGAASEDFARYFNKSIDEIKRQINEIQAAQTAANIATNLAQGASSQAATAAATATSAGAGLPSASIVGQVFNATSTTPTTIALVDLIGVVAGNLRFDTTRLYYDSSTSFSPSVADSVGSFIITEKLTSGVGSENTLVSGTWTATDTGGFVVLMIDDEATLDAARPAAGITGDVTYRLKVSKDIGQSSVLYGLADFRAAQA